jgi:hypothetical protein
MVRAVQQRQCGVRNGFELGWRGQMATSPGVRAAWRVIFSDLVEVTAHAHVTLYRAGTA